MGRKAAVTGGLAGHNMSELCGNFLRSAAASHQG